MLVTKYLLDNILYPDLISILHYVLNIQSTIDRVSVYNILPF